MFGGDFVGRPFGQVANPLVFWPKSQRVIARTNDMVALFDAFLSAGQRHTTTETFDGVRRAYIFQPRTFVWVRASGVEQVGLNHVATLGYLRLECGQALRIGVGKDGYARLLGREGV